jgi:hypothetical protein
MKSIILKLNNLCGEDIEGFYGNETIFFNSAILSKNGVSWEESHMGYGFVACREEFQHFYPTLKRKKESVVLYNRNTSSENIEIFLDEIEEKLKITKKTKVFKCLSGKQKYLSLIAPADFWLENELVFSLFTIILRASKRYKLGDDCMKTIFKEEYARKTKDVVNRLFEGHKKVNSKYKEEQWLDCFLTKGYRDRFGDYHQSNLEEEYYRYRNRNHKLNLPFKEFYKKESEKILQ